MKFFLIAKTEANWNEFLTNMKFVLGKSITTDLDLKGIDVGSTKSLITLLGGDHVMYTLGLVLPQEICVHLLQEQHRLTISLKDTVTRSHSLAIVTGTITEWKESINNLSKNDDVFVQNMMREIKGYFEVEENLGELKRIGK